MVPVEVPDKGTANTMLLGPMGEVEGVERLHIVYMLMAGRVQVAQWWRFHGQVGTDCMDASLS